MYLQRKSLITLAGTGAVSVATATAVAVTLLVGAGAAYRTFAAASRISSDTRIELPIPLEGIPRQVDGWVGEDVEIEASVDTYMKANFADDYISRRYINASKQLSASAYIVYCSTRPAGILGHKPQVCYPANGWIWDDTTPSEFATSSGRVVECLIHRFHTPAPAFREAYVLNFYVRNGRITLRESEFSGWSARKLNFSGNYGRYVAQVQISSATEHAVRALASAMGDIILSFLPDQNGRVQAAGAQDERTQAGGAAVRDR